MTVLILSALLMTMFFAKCLRALNSGVVFSGGSQSIEKFWYEVRAVSSSLASVEQILIT